MFKLFQKSASDREMADEVKRFIEKLKPQARFVCLASEPKGGHVVPTAMSQSALEAVLDRNLTVTLDMPSRGFSLTRTGGLQLA